MVLLANPPTNEPTVEIGSSIMAPRRGAAMPIQADLGPVLRVSLHGARIARLTQSHQLLAYHSVDFKKGVDYTGLAEEADLLGRLLDICPSGILAQRALHSALAKEIKQLGIKTNAPIELESYKMRAMMSHLALIRKRGLPKNLNGDIQAILRGLLGKLDQEPSARQARSCFALIILRTTPPHDEGRLRII